MGNGAVSCADVARHSCSEMQIPPAKPDPEATLLAPGVSASEGCEVWVFEGSLERFLEVGELPERGARRYRFQQRIAWRTPPTEERVTTLGRWITARLSINGHLLVGLRARPEAAPPEEARLVG
jgi:hypothetical protein